MLTMLKNQIRGVSADNVIRKIPLHRSSPASCWTLLSRNSLPSLAQLSVLGPSLKHKTFSSYIVDDFPGHGLGPYIRIAVTGKALVGVSHQGGIKQSEPVF